MNSKLSLLAGVAVLAAGLSFARPVQQVRDPIERIDELEKQVAALKTELAALRKSPAAAEGEDPLRRDVDQLQAWVKAQAAAADALTRTLDESREKGFTAGINPDSRTVLLAGFAQFAGSLRKPLAPPTPDAPKPRGDRNQRR